MADRAVNAPGGSLGFDPAFVAQARGMLGAETETFLAALDGKPALALRINPLRAGAEAVTVPFVDGIVPWEKYGRYLAPGAKPGASIWHFAGAFYVQEASAMLPAAVLGARPGEKILDLCAAPGGKSSQIAAAMNGEGLLIANEPEPKRARMLAGNLERLGVKNAAVVNEYPPKLAEKWPGFFDAIMVDAPCSGEGMFRREPASRGEWNENSPAGCAQRQVGILDAAAVMLRPGGRMVYSTCTYNTLEDEETVAAFLDRRPDFRAVDFEVGGLGASVNGMMKIWPHRARGDGQFAALLVKDGDASSDADMISHRDKAAGAVYSQFISAFADPGNGFVPLLQGDLLWAVREGMPDMRGIKVVAPGIALARVLKGRIEPEHQAAMALDGLNFVELDAGSAEAFCRGEAVPCGGSGWLAARFGGMPLGWGKASGDVLKNHLPKGLRRRVVL